MAEAPDHDLLAVIAGGHPAARTAIVGQTGQYSALATAVGYLRLNAADSCGSLRMDQHIQSNPHSTAVYPAAVTAYLEKNCLMKHDH